MILLEEEKIIVTELKPMSECPVRKKVMIECNFFKCLEVAILNQERDKVFLIHGGMSISVNDCNGWLPCLIYQPERKEPDRSQPPCTECGAMTVEQALEKCICAAEKDFCHGNELWG